MQLKTRKDAYDEGETKFFTGKPCKNGHITYRYVQSGSCADCINYKFKHRSTDININPALKERLEKEEQQKAIAVAQATLRKGIRLACPLFRLRIFNQDVAAVRDMTLAFTRLNYPEATIDDIDPRLRPLDVIDGTAVYQFYCPPEYLNELIKYAGVLFSKTNNFDIKGALERIHGHINKDAIAQIEPVPEWADKP